MKNPGKDLPKAIVGGLSLVMAVYVVINLAYLWVLPASELAKYASPASAVAEVLFGSIGGKIINCWYISICIWMYKWIPINWTKNNLYIRKTKNYTRIYIMVN